MVTLGCRGTRLVWGVRLLTEVEVHFSFPLTGYILLEAGTGPPGWFQKLRLGAEGAPHQQLSTGGAVLVHLRSLRFHGFQAGKGMMRTPKKHKWLLAVFSGAVQRLENGDVDVYLSLGELG